MAGKSTEETFKEIISTNAHATENMQPKVVATSEWEHPGQFSCIQVAQCMTLQCMNPLMPKSMVKGYHVKVRTGMSNTALKST